MRLIVLLLCLAGLAACDRQKAEVQQGEPAGVAGPRPGLDRSKQGESRAAVTFLDSDGEQAGIADFRGRPVLVNLWATWCAPCVKELPTLNSLAEAQGEALQVVAISQDRGPAASVAAFLDHVGARALEPFRDPEMRLSGELGVQVLPTTILIDREGRERWRYIGDRDWNAPEVAQLLAEAGR